jgi:hypothetical protein
MQSGPPLSSVDAIRDELRRLGYLDHGVDRFVLGGAGQASPARASAAAALRVGLLGGVLFAGALALAAAVLQPRLREEPRDLLVLSGYLVVALGAMIAVLTFLGGLAAAGWGRRGARPRPGAARNVGVAAAAAALAYLALWWRSHAVGASAAFQAGALLVGLLLAAALGRFASLAAVAVLSAGGLSSGVPPASVSRRRLLPIVAALALVAAGAAAVAAYVGEGARAESPDFAVVPTGLCVRVLGIDGLDRRMAEERMARGEMPHLAALVARGARAVLLPEPEHVPAIVWTTLATGRGPEAHGIRATGTRRLAGMRTPVALGDEGALARGLTTAADLLRLSHTQPASAVLRQAKTFWNVASEKGLRVGVVNWWATWPADPVNGYVVTERAVFKLERGGAFDRETWPADVFEKVKPLVTTDGDRARALDGFHVRAALALRREARPDVEAVYLPGLDIATMQRLGEAGAGDLAGLDARLVAVRAAYAAADALLGAYAADLAADEVLLVVGDPGRLPRKASGAEGLLVLVGPAIQPGDAGRVSERDVAPTVLHLAGLPVSRELEGKVVEAALSLTFRKDRPVRYVATYGRRPRGRAAESAFDQEMLEQLRSLGYIQ